MDILSIRLIPKVANYADAGAAARTEIRNRVYRQALYTHTPGRVEYRVKIPDGGRLDFAMGVLREDVPVTFRVTAISDGAGAGEPAPVFEERYAIKEAWGQRWVDLADFSGQTVTLGLEAESEEGGRVALWGAPTLTGGGPSPLPNVVFYVFDGGAADYMGSSPFRVQRLSAMWPVVCGHRLSDGGPGRAIRASLDGHRVGSALTRGRRRAGPPSKSGARAGGLRRTSRSSVRMTETPLFSLGCSYSKNL